MTNKTRIPNLNSHATILDRLAIEVVKLCQFETGTATDKAQKIKTQIEIIDEIKKIAVIDFKEIVKEREYSYYGEKRTFDL